MLGLSVGVLVIELVGGLLSNSLALLADAGHMLTDVAGLGLALVALWRASLWTLIVAITVPEIPRVTRLVRSLVLSIREEPYVEAAMLTWLDQGAPDRDAVVARAREAGVTIFAATHSRSRPRSAIVSRETASGTPSGASAGTSG